jgi:hypothetical protein
VRPAALPRVQHLAGDGHARVQDDVILPLRGVEPAHGPEARQGDPAVGQIADALDDAQVLAAVFIEEVDVGGGEGGGVEDPSRPASKRGV